MSRVLFLDSSNLTVFRVQKGAVDIEAVYPGNGAADFAVWLGKHRNDIYLLLADVPDDGYQYEEIPFARGADREALLKRRMAQFYFGTPYVAAISQGRVSDGRRDERILFSAFTRPQFLQPWLDALTESRTALAGLYSIPFVLNHLVREELKLTPRCLVVNLTSGGLRQTFFDQGRPRFSRLTQAPPGLGATTERTVFFVSETSKTHQYLHAQRMITRDAPLDVLLLADGGETQRFREGHLNSLELRFTVIDSAVAVRRAGLLGGLPSGRETEALLAYLLAQSPPQAQYAPPAARHFYFLRLIRQGLMVTGAAAIGLALLTAIGLSWYASRASARTEELTASAVSLESRYQAELAILPKINISKDDLRAVMKSYDEVARLAVGPLPMLRNVAIVLNDFPRIEVEQLTWSVTNQLDDAQRGARPPTPSALPTDAAHTKPLGAGPFSVLDIVATMPLSMTSDHRAQLDLLNEFVARLTTDAAVQVQILVRPFDVESGKTIKSGGDTIVAEAPRFSVRVIRKL